MNQQAPAWPEANPGTKPQAQAPAPPHANPNAVEHAQLGAQDKQEGGKDMGLVHAPVVSMHPTSADQSNDKPKKDFKFIKNANIRLNHDMPDDAYPNVYYPFSDLEIGDGLFIPVETTTDALMASLYKQVNQYRKQNSEVERDENGDDIMIDLAVNQKKRNEDGTVQLDGDKPRLGIKSGFVPKLAGPSFIVKAVVKGDEVGENNKAEGDGALVIRMG